MGKTGGRGLQALLPSWYKLNLGIGPRAHRFLVGSYRSGEQVEELRAAMTQANIHVFENLHEHREFHERVFTSDGAWERKRTDRGTVPFPTAVILDTCSPDRDAVCEWRVDKIAANGGVCMGVSDLNNEQILEDWAGSGKQDRVWYSILRGGWNAIGGVNNGNISVADSLPPFKSGC
eukprot:2945019-Rhodomonas_salina.1